MSTEFIPKTGIGITQKIEPRNESKGNLCPSVLQSLPSINVKVLPSQFLPYPKNSTASYRVFSFGEIQYLNSSKISEKDIFEYLLNGITTSFPKEDLTVPDFLYLGWLRKISSIGSNKISLGMYCPECKKQSATMIEVNDLDFEDIKAPELPVIATFGDVSFSFVPITLKNYFDLKEKGYDNDTVASLAIQCLNHNFEDAYKLIYNASPDWIAVFEEIDRLLSHGTKPIKFQCQNKIDDVVCDNKLELPIEGGEVLFHPFRGCKVDVKDRIRFGNAPAH